MDHTYLGHLMANEQEATLSASGSTGGSHRGSSYEDEDEDEERGSLICVKFLCARVILQVCVCVCVLSLIHI